MKTVIEGTMLVSEDEATTTFISVLSDVYDLKEFMVSQLTEVANRSGRAELKMLIVNAGTSLNTQLLKMDMAVSMLHEERSPKESFINYELNYQKYLYKGIDSGNSYLNDIKLLSHIMVLIGIEVNSFRVLDVLSKKIKPKAVNALMRENLKEAVKNQNEVIEFYNSYLQ